MTILFVLIALLATLFAGLALWTRHLGRGVTDLVPQKGKIQPVNGGKIHYIDIGPRDAPALVLVHGLSGQMQHFTYALTDPLSRDFRVIAIDRPGCGYSERDSESSATLPEQARMIGELLDHLNVSNPMLVGHSLGGAVVLAMALDRPDKTAGIALICPLTHPEEDPSAAFGGLNIRNETMRRLLGHTLAVPMARRTAEAVLNMVFAPDPVPEDFLISGGGALGLRPKAFITASSDFVAADQAIRAQHLRYTAELNIPGGVLFGADDTLLSPATHGAPMTAFGLVHEVLDNRGHMIPLTAPAETEAFIRRMAGVSFADQSAAS